MIGDAGIAHKLRVKSFPVQGASGLLTGAAASVSEGAGSPAHGAASPAASELTGMPMATNDEVYFAIARDELWDLDLSKELEARLIYESAGDAADTSVVFKGWIKGVALGEALSDAKSSEDGTCTWTEPALGGADKLEATNWEGLGVAGKLGDDTLLMFAVECDADGDCDADELILLALQLRGTGQICNADMVPERTS